MPRLWITLRVTRQSLGQPCGLTTYPRASRTTKAFFLTFSDWKGEGNEEHEKNCTALRGARNDFQGIGDSKKGSTPPVIVSPGAIRGAENAMFCGASPVIILAAFVPVPISHQTLSAIPH